MSVRYELDKQDLLEVLKVFLWSLTSAVVAGLMYVCSGAIELPVWFLPLVPMVNAFLYGMSQWIKDNS